MQNVADVPGLPLTHHKLVTVVECDEPALTGHHAHLSDVMNVDQSVSMNSAKRAVLQTFLERFQIVGS